MRFAPAASQAYAGDISHESVNATTVNIAVSGTGIPVITVSGTNLDFGNIEAGIASTAQTYTIEGSYLTADISITAPTGFEVSNDGTTYASSLTLTQISGSVAQTTIYARFTPTAEQAYLDDITHVSNGATNVNLSVSGNGVSSTVPILSVSETSIGFGDVSVGSTSGAQSYVIEGSNLTDDITITAPSGFFVSDDGINYSAFLILTMLDNSVDQTDIYIQFSPTEPKSYSENVTHESAGAISVNLVVLGNSTSTAINDVDSDNYIKISPNPSNGLITIEYNQANREEASIEIINSSGVLVYKTRISSSKQIDLQQQAKGLYFVRIITDDTIQTEKIIIK